MSTALQGHSVEFLREIMHLRPRSNLIGSVLRVRNALSSSIHDFFQRNGFLHMHTPILTSNDCEGAGELFRVDAPLDEHSEADAPSKQPRHFFGREAFLTVSGQLQAEAFTTALGNVYTFGPTFRAEVSGKR